MTEEPKKNGFLVLKRKEGEEIEVIHSASGDRFTIKAYGISGDSKGHKPRVNLSFGDHDRSFEFVRIEAKKRIEPAKWKQGDDNVEPTQT